MKDEGLEEFERKLRRRQRRWDRAYLAMLWIFVSALIIGEGIFFGIREWRIWNR